MGTTEFLIGRGCLEGELTLPSVTNSWKWCYLSGVLLWSMFNESILIDKAVFHSQEKRRQRSEDESSPDFNNVLLTGVIFWESASSQINSTVLSLITTLPDIISPPQSILNFLTKPSAFYKLLLCFARNSIDLEVCQSPSTLKSPTGQVSLEAFPRQIEAKIHTQKKNIFLWYWLHIVSDVSVLHQMVKLEWLRFEF